MRVAVIDLDSLSRNWWVVLLRGLAGIVFGIATFFAPGISLAALVLVFVALALELRWWGRSHEFHATAGVA